MIAEMRDKQQEIAALCERFEVIRLGTFGSAARGDFDPSKSDLDFLVLFDRRDDADYLDRFLVFSGLSKRCLIDRLIW